MKQAWIVLKYSAGKTDCSCCEELLLWSKGSVLCALCYEYLHYTASDGRITNELERIWKKVVMAKSK
jgi:hypothetical protein